MRRNRTSVRRWKHPHLRGENSRTTIPLLHTSETSPPAWGKHVVDREAGVGAGNIPTCVGKTRAPRSRSCLSGKHPHLRGENRLGNSCESSATETSPPAWGKLQRKDANRILRGNIPTCVGKTARPSRSVTESWKHPHLRGENYRNTFVASMSLETSPPAWGKPSSWRSTTVRSGNIPTCVGKTRDAAP